MKYIHVTESKNLSSIKEKGLVPKRAYLKHHRELFKDVLKTVKVVYLTKYESKKRTEKFLKDFVYFQLWGKPRNLYIEKNGWDLEGMYGTKFEIKVKKFSILTVDIAMKKEKIIMKGTHSQGLETNTKEMNPDYAHNDKPLLILGRNIKPEEIKLNGSLIPVVRNNVIQNVRIDW